MFFFSGLPHWAAGCCFTNESPNAQRCLIIFPWISTEKMKSSPEPFNLTFLLKEGNSNQAGKRVIEVQCFIHNSAVLSVSREMQFMQLTEERVLSERQNKRVLIRLHTHTEELQSAGSDLSNVAALHHSVLLQTIYTAAVNPIINPLLIKHFH